jgi:hypothetical protein
LKPAPHNEIDHTIHQVLLTTFDEYWEFHLRQEYERNHAKKYKNGRVPSAPPATKGKQKASSLKLIKQKRTVRDDEKEQGTRSYDSLETISLKKRDDRKR